MSLIDYATALYYSPLARTLLHNAVFCLERELKGCQTVLDLGCGYNSPLRYCRTGFSVGAEYFLPYLRESRQKGIHRAYVRVDIHNAEFRPRSFDAVLLLSVIEHMDKEAGLKLLGKVSAIARKKIILISPNGYLSQGPADDNALQAHRSGWRVDELRGLGFSAMGLNGLKIFRKATHRAGREDYANSLLSTVKFRPRILWLAIAELSQVIAYRFPASAFEVFYVKEVSG